LPRGEDGEPKDKKLEELGCLFFARIEAEKWAAAKQTLHQIELRAAELLKGME
jgi:hypothetical protein